MSKVLTIRLSPAELAMLDMVRRSDVRGDLTPSELVRLLLHREYNRRQGLPAPTPAAYQTDFRNFRPRKA